MYLYYILYKTFSFCIWQQITNWLANGKKFHRPLLMRNRYLPHQTAWSICVSYRIFPLTHTHPRPHTHTVLLVCNSSYSDVSSAVNVADVKSFVVVREATDCIKTTTAALTATNVPDTMDFVATFASMNLDHIDVRVTNQRMIRYQW